MDRREAEWLERRESLRGSAPRVQLEQPVGAVPPPTSAPTPTTTHPVAQNWAAPGGVGGPAAASAPRGPGKPSAASAPGEPSAASAPDKPSASGGREAPSAPGDATPAYSPGHKPARKLSAAALLGVSGASLVILAAIVFVAASWDNYIPIVRAGFLIAFAGFFAWLGLRATRDAFPTIGGSLGVVAIGFVGVSQIAWRMNEDGAQPYTAALFFSAAAIAGVALDRTHLRAVGATAAVAVHLAVLSAGIEYALGAQSAGIATARFVIVAALPAVALIWLGRLWVNSRHRDIVKWSGATIAIAAATPTLFVPISIEETGLLALSAMTAGITALAAVAIWRPIVGAGPLTGVAIITAAILVNQFVDSVWQTNLVLALLVVVAVVLLSRGTPPWRAAGLAGLGLPVLWLAVVSGIIGITAISSALLGSDARFPQGFTTQVPAAKEVMAYAGVIFVLACAAWLMRTWRLGARAEAARVGAGAWLSAAAAIVAGCGVGTIWTGARWLNAPGIIASAIVLWFVWRAWGPSQRRPMQIAAIVVAALVAVIGPFRIATVASDMSTADVTTWAISAVIAVAGLAYASETFPQAAFMASMTSTMLGGAVIWWATENLGLTVVVAAAIATAIAGVGVVLGKRSRSDERTSSVAMSDPLAAALVGALPAVVIGSFFAAYSAVVGICWTLAPAGSWAISMTWAEPAAALITVCAGLLFARAFRGPVNGGFASLIVTIGLILVIPQASGRLAMSLPDAEHPWLPVAVLLIAVAVWLVTALKVLRPSRAPVAVAGVVATSTVTVTWLVRMAEDGPEWRIIVALAVVALAGVAFAMRWPAYTLAPAVATASLIAPAALAQSDLRAAAIAAAAGMVILAWVHRLAVRRDGRPALWLIAMAPAALISAGSVVTALAVASRAWIESRSAGSVDGQWWAVAAIVLVVAAVFAWPPVRRHGASILLGAAAVAAGLVPDPIGWVALAVLAPAIAEAGVRWAGRLGTGRLHGVWAIIAAAAWMPWRAGPAAIVEALAVAVLVWTATRAERRSAARGGTAIAAPLVAVFAAMHTFLFFGAGYGPSALGGAVIGFTVALALVAAKVLAHNGAAWVLGAITVIMPFATMHVLSSGLLVLVASAAWYALFALNGVVWARITALWLLSPAAVLLLAAVGATALEAYVAVPGATMLGLGLLRMRRDPAMRTYAALAPGLGLILIPSYIAMALDPELLIRPLALVFAAAVLGIIGVWRQWFAPLLGTAVTAVVLATSQVVVDEALVPRWVSFGFIGAVLLVLGFTAERIRTMR